MKKTSGWFSVPKIKASWSRANFEMVVSLHSTVFPLDPNTRPSNAWRFTPWWSLGSSECREWALGARNCRWCPGDPPRSRHIRCGFKILNHGFLKENHLELVEDSYHSIPMFNYQRFGIHGWRVWMPWPISVFFSNGFFWRQQALVKPWRRLGYQKKCNWQKKIWWLLAVLYGIYSLADVWDMNHSVLGFLRCYYLGCFTIGSQVQISQAVSDEIPFELFWPMVKDDIALWLCRIGGDETGSAMYGYVWLGRLFAATEVGIQPILLEVSPL